MSDRIQQEGLRKLAEAKKTLQHSRSLDGALLSVARAQASKALTLLRSAMNYLEDTPQFEQAHVALDRAGLYYRRRFGCTLTYENGTYYQACPVALAHNRLGLSVEMIVSQFICSVCGGDASECEHIRGSKYDRVLCQRIKAVCNICGDAEGCEHEGGTLYDEIEAFRFVSKIESLEAVAIVSRPAQPDARFMRISIDEEELRAARGDSFEPGMEIGCDMCLEPCGGVIEHDLDAVRQSIKSS